MAKLLSFNSYLDKRLADNPGLAAEIDKDFQGLRFGAMVAMLREKREMTQTQLAEVTGMKQPNIVRIEKGIIPSAQNMTKIARALNGCIVLRPDGSLTIEAAEHQRLAA